MIHAESNRPNCIISSTRLESFLRAVPRRESEYAALARRLGVPAQRGIIVATRNTGQ